MDSVSEALESALNRSPEPESVVITLELVVREEDDCCANCCFQADSCLVRGVLPCTGGYWRVSSK